MLRPSLVSLLVLAAAWSNAVGQQSSFSSPQHTVSAPHGEPVVQAHSVRVAAINDEWTATGLYMNAGDCMMIFTNESKIRVGAGWEVDANGASTGQGQLRGKIGVGTVFPVGMRASFCVQEKGSMKLKVADTRYDDNVGEFTVLLIRIPGQLIPAARQYSSEE